MKRTILVFCCFAFIGSSVLAADASQRRAAQPSEFVPSVCVGVSVAAVLPVVAPAAAAVGAGRGNRRPGSPEDAQPPRGWGVRRAWSGSSECSTGKK